MSEQPPLLEVDGLKTWFDSGDQQVRAVDGVSFTIKKGETFALLGESGCGKSMTSLSIMRLVPEPAGKIVQGHVKLYGQDLLQMTETHMRDVRGGRIAMIFQEPMTSLNPVLTIGEQIEETAVRHKTLKEGQSPEKKAIELLTAVGIPDPQRRYREYPHQLSGGMKQRVMIAIALAGDPELLIADEPTTALDVTIQSQILQLLRELQQKIHMAVMLITHDLGVVAEMADRVAVMYAGEIVEQASREQFFKAPKHPYSIKLFDSLPNRSKRNQRLAVIQGFVPSLATEFKGCRFEPRCEYAIDACKNNVPTWQGIEDEGIDSGVSCHRFDPQFKAQFSEQTQTTSRAADLGGAVNSSAHKELLRVQELKVHFPIQKGLFKRTVGYVRAVDGVSVDIPQGKTLALVGESGCGKTTVGKGILQLISPTAGSVSLNNDELTELSKAALRQRRKDIQIIFQDPFSSMNPRMMVADIIEEGMIAQRVGGDKQQRKNKIDELLNQVGLSPEVKFRYPHEFSGGQRQRICIARALAVEPKLIICDEPTSALDVSVQAQILNLLKELQDKFGLAYLFITHNLSVVEYLAHEVAVMYLGRIVESGTVDEVLENPLHPYTKALLSAVPKVDIDSERKVIRLRGELPSPANPPVGCHFNPRCAQAWQECRNGYPSSRSVTPTHSARCFLYKES
ncbi:MAG: ABC transporter ATP-binding protein [Gammaproteobacteria bacterium SG8_11]|nr:MAG: ABC transporter ATP-binding protein [Gammaproteobacteria bacterium SG8_11]